MMRYILIGCCFFCSLFLCLFLFLCLNRFIPADLIAHTGNDLLKVVIPAFHLL